MKIVKEIVLLYMKKGKRLRTSQDDTIFLINSACDNFLFTQSRKIRNAGNEDIVKAYFVNEHMLRIKHRINNAISSCYFVEAFLIALYINCTLRIFFSV